MSDSDSDNSPFQLPPPPPPSPLESKAPLNIIYSNNVPMPLHLHIAQNAMMMFDEYKTGVYNKNLNEISFTLHLSDKTFTTHISSGNKNKDKYCFLLLFLDITLHLNNNSATFKLYSKMGDEYTEDDLDPVYYGKMYKIYNHLLHRVSYTDCRFGYRHSIGSPKTFPYDIKSMERKELKKHISNILNRETVSDWSYMNVCTYCNTIFIDNKSSSPTIKLCWKCKTNSYILQEGQQSMERCCICFEDISYLDRKNICMDTRHTIHMGCYNQLKNIQGIDVHCPLCRRDYSTS